MSKPTIDQLVEICQQVFTKMINHDDEETIASRNFGAPLGADNENYYSNIVDALSQTGKVIRLQGRKGGIRYRPAKRQERKLVDNNLKKLHDYFVPDLEIPEVSDVILPQETSDKSKEENAFYEPLRDCFDKSGIYICRDLWTA